MSNIILPSDRIVQPQDLVKESPIWKPAAVWNLATNTESVNGKLSTIGPNSGRVVTNLGYGVTVTGVVNLDRYVLNCPKEAIYIGDGDFTLLVKFRLDDLIGQFIIGRMGTTTSASEFGISATGNFNVSTGVQFRIVVGGVTKATSATGVTWTIGSTYTVIGRRKGTFIYVDILNNTTGEISRASFDWVDLTTGNYFAANKLTLGQSFSTANNSSTTTYIAATFTRYISDTAVNRLLENPWQILETRKRHFFIPPPPVPVPHPSIGAIAGQVTNVTGAAVKTRNHPSTGAVAGQVTNVTGAAIRTRPHPSTGAIAGQNAIVSGAAVRVSGVVTHASTGAIAGQTTTVVGAAVKTLPHPSTGAIAGQTTNIVGAAVRFTSHPSTGAVAGQITNVSGAAVHIADITHASTGVIAGQVTNVSGVAAHTGLHVTSGVIAGQITLVAGTAQNGLEVPKRKGSRGLAYWKFEEPKIEEPEIEEELEDELPGLFEHLRSGKLAHDMKINAIIARRKMQDEQIIEMYLKRLK